ncbi:MAG: DUF554 domain-containing protein [Candidatus Hodarchaeales archaeon]
MENFTVVIGSLIGLTIGKFYTEDMKDITIKCLALLTIIIGIYMCFSTSRELGAIEFLTAMFSLIFGSITGVLLKIEENLKRFGNWLKEKSKSQETTFIEGFVTASIIFETGPLAILGAINDGIKSDLNLLLIKSGLDGMMAIALSSSLGIGVVFSIISVITYQGSITLLAGILEPYLLPIVQEMISFVGGILILGLGIRILELQDIKIGNMLPAVLWVVPITIILDFGNKRLKRSLFTRLEETLKTPRDKSANSCEQQGIIHSYFK